MEPHTLLLSLHSLFSLLRMDKPEDRAKTLGAEEQKNVIKMKCAYKVVSVLGSEEQV